LGLLRVELFHKQFDEGSLSNPGWPAHHDVELAVPRESRGHLVDDVVNLSVYRTDLEIGNDTVMALQEGVSQGRVCLLLVFCALVQLVRGNSLMSLLKVLIISLFDVLIIVKLHLLVQKVLS
jgi:hypothetical protein